jgi:hypothetical protein
VVVRPVPASDPREGLAGVGAAVRALRDLPNRAVIGPYAAWVTTPDDFDARVALRERADYEAYAVTTEAARVRVAGEDEAPLMFVAFPPAVANATAQLNDWRAQPWLVAAAAGDGDASGPNCELVRRCRRASHSCSADAPCHHSWRCCMTAGPTYSWSPRVRWRRMRS